MASGIAMSTPFFVKPETSDELRAFYERLDAKSAAPLWEALDRLVTSEPKPACVPALWRYEEMRPLLMEAGRSISPEKAERRVLVLENPGLRGRSQITQSLYAGLQLVLPGEIARGHRHTASALRFVLEGSCGYTAVEGERATMRPGDFILTPSWTLHDHGNPGEEPVVWLDGLDVPIVNLFDASFAEHGPDEMQTAAKNEGDSLARFGANLLPVEHRPSSLATPVFTYPYDRSREALDRLLRNGPVDSRHGVKMQYVNPATGGYPLPTIAAFLQLLPKGFRGEPSRSTDAAVYCVAEGSGRSRVGRVTLDWRPRDVFVVPSWAPVSHEAAGEAVLFSFSDRPVQKALGFWREASV
jgi:gentisate 1,2-dioxygenase